MDLSRKSEEIKVALITGGNTGIGFALALRLLQHDVSIHVCLGCRNELRAEAARSLLLSKCPEANVSILLIDVAKPASVYQAAADVRQRFRHIDYLFLNAGIMPGTTVDWSNFWNQLFSSRCVHMFATGDGLLRQTDELTDDGLKQIFATNIFGHFILVNELQSLARGPDHPLQIVWTSSSNAKKEAFQLDDIQHEHGVEPYSASKYASDVLSYAFNVRLNSKNVYSHTACPGLVMTNLTYGILPDWIWLLLLPILWLLRLFTANLTINPEAGCEVLFWLSQQKPETLNPCAKYKSQVSFTGRVYTSETKVSIDPELALKTFDKLSDMEKAFHPPYS